MLYNFSFCILIWRFLAFDAVCLLPRQPFSWLLGFLPQRWIALNASDSVFYYFGWFFDADISPIIVLATLAWVLISDQLRRKYLWESRKRRFMTIFILVISPLTCIHKIQNILAASETITHQVIELFGNTTLHPMAATHSFSVTHALYNHHGSKYRLYPNKTYVYKEFLPVGSTCAERRELFYAESMRRNKLTRSLGKLELEVIFPRRDIGSLAPIVFWLHGGGWQVGCRSFISTFGGGVMSALHEQGYVIVSASYRLLCDGASLKDMEADVFDGVRFVAENAFRWNGDRDKIALFGGSAGAHLALMTSLATTTNLIKATVSLYAPTLLTVDLVDTLTARTDAWSYEKLFHSKQYLKSISMLDVGAHSPVEITRNIPLLVIHGECDPIVPLFHGEYFKERMRNVGATKFLFVSIPCALHNFDSFASHHGSQITTFATERFLFNVFYN